MSGGRTKVLVGDALEVLDGLPEQKIHAIVCDPDYGVSTKWVKGDNGRMDGTNQGWEVMYSAAKYHEFSRRWAQASLRVVRPAAHMLAFGTGRTIHRMAAGMEDAGWAIKYMGAWYHNQSTPVYGQRSRIRNVCDLIVIAQAPYKGTLKDCVERWGTGELNDVDGSRPKTVWECSKARTEECPSIEGIERHTATKPLRLMRQLVTMACPPGGIVLDPFAGSGTTIEAALLEGRSAIAIEQDPDWARLIQARIDRFHRGESPQ